MRDIDGPPGMGLPALEICKHCQLFWFDPGRYRSMPRAELPEPQVAHPVRDAIRASQDARRERSEVRPVEELNWQVVFAPLALPIELEAPVRWRLPVLTVALAALLVAVSIVALFTDLHAPVRTSGLQASRPGRFGGLTLLTAFFLHADPVHFLSNV